MPTYIITRNTSPQNASGTRFGGTDDTELRESSANSNYDTNSSVRVGIESPTNRKFMLFIAQGLSNVVLQPGERLDFAQLFLFRHNSNGEEHPVQLRRVLRPWVEGQATWNRPQDGENWDVPGALGEGTDILPFADDVVTVQPDIDQYWAFNVTESVNAWLSGEPNYGWHISLNEVGGNNDYHNFRAEEGNNGERPELVVNTFFTPTSIMHYQYRRRR